MAWETRNGRGRYYTRSKRVHGRVVREYVGSGELAELIAELDEQDRRETALAKEAQQAEKDEARVADEALGRLCDLAEQAVKTALLEAGFHQHKRTWRRRREQ